jgi:hypothetical protein
MKKYKFTTKCVWLNEYKEEVFSFTNKIKEDEIIQECKQWAIDTCDFEYNFEEII